MNGRYVPILGGNHCGQSENEDERGLKHLVILKSAVKLSGSVLEMDDGGGAGGTYTIR
jgi:hypothetical protein